MGSPDVVPGASSQPPLSRGASVSLSEDEDVSGSLELSRRATKRAHSSDTTVVGATWVGTWKDQATRQGFVVHMGVVNGHWPLVIRGQLPRR